MCTYTFVVEQPEDDYGGKTIEAATAPKPPMRTTVRSKYSINSNGPLQKCNIGLLLMKMILPWTTTWALDMAPNNPKKEKNFPIYPCESAKTLRTDLKVQCHQESKKNR